jgi:hypothetical protein
VTVSVTEDASECSCHVMRHEGETSRHSVTSVGMSLTVPLFDDKDAWITPGVGVAVLALFFTVGSFWWIQVRRGRLRCYTSHVYSGCYAKEMIYLVLPLVLYNPAPAPLVVIDLRIRINNMKGKEAEDRAELPMCLRWIASHAAVYPRNETRTFAAPFPVDGRKAVEKFVEFQKEAPTTLLDDGPYEATVEALIEPKWWARRKWKKIYSYQFNTQLATQGRNSILPRSNDPEYHTSE